MTHAQGGFSLEDSAKLRRLVDLGVTLWFDDCAGARTIQTGPSLSATSILIPA